jgi:antitoxin ParD1/3/4
MRVKQELRRKDIERLRRLWDEGKASGPAEPFDVERTLAAARARLKEIVAENDARPSIAAIAPP